MAHSGDGTGWDVASPADAESRRNGAMEIRDLRTGVGLRLSKEHIALATTSAGGEHKAGSAKAFVPADATARAALKRPDTGSGTTLASADAGRIAVQVDTSVLWYWTGSAWAQVKALPEDNSITTAMLINGVLSADATGRAKMADGFLTAAKLAASIGLCRVKFGTYTGSASDVTVTGLGFKPEVVIVLVAATLTFSPRIGMKAISGDVAWDLYSFYDSHKTEDDAIEASADGFTVYHVGHISDVGVAYFYIALAEA